MVKTVPAAAREAEAAYVPKRHSMHKKHSHNGVRETAALRCMLAAGCTLVEADAKLYLKATAYNHVRNIIRVCTILASHDDCGTLSVHHLKLALQLCGCAMMGEFVPRLRKASSKPAPLPPANAE